MSKHVSLFILFIVVSSSIFSQKTIDEWLKENSYLNKEEYFFVKSSPIEIDKNPTETILEARKVTSKSDAKDKLIKELQVGIYFVPIDFYTTEVYYSYHDEKAKTIQTAVVINKSKISSFFMKDVERQYEELQSSLKENDDAKSFKTEQLEEILSNAKQTKKKLSNLQSIAFKLNPDIDTKVAFMWLNSIDNQLNNLGSKLDNTIILNLIKKAEFKFTANDFIGAYKNYTELLVLYPNNQTVLNGKEKSFEKIKSTFEYKIDNFVQSNDYKSAILTLDSLVNLDVDLYKIYQSKKEDYKIKYFYSTVEKIEKLLTYHSVSVVTVKDLMKDLGNIKNVDEQRYLKIKEETESRLLDYDLKILKSYVYNKEFKTALKFLPELKYNYPRNKAIEKTENKIDRKIYTNFKKELLSTRPKIYSLEPSVSLMTSERGINDLMQVSVDNLSMMYSLGIYRRFSLKPKRSQNHFSYSSLGVKIDYLDPTTIINRNDSLYNLSAPNKFINPQISLSLRKTLYFDLGYVKRIGVNDFGAKDYYSMGASIFIPIRVLSFGVTGKYISDFVKGHTLMLGGSIKINFGLIKKFKKNEKEEIQTKILLLKQ